MIKTLTKVKIPPGLPVSPCEQREHIELTIPCEQDVRRNGWFRRLPVENLSSKKKNWNVTFVFVKNRMEKYSLRKQSPSSDYDKKVVSIKNKLACSRSSDSRAGRSDGGERVKS